MSRYYKLKIDGELNQILDEIDKTRKAFFKELRKLAKEHGARTDEAQGNMERGIIFALQFSMPPDPKLWKPWQKHRFSDAYAPRLNSKAGRELSERFQNLPSVDYGPLWDHINWAKDQFRGNRVFFHPGYAVSKDKKWLVLEFEDGVRYKPLKTMVPLTWEDWVKLSGHKEGK